MPFKVPEERRLTVKNAKGWSYLGKEILDLVSEAHNTEDGFFFIPVVNSTSVQFNKSAKFLCRATLVAGWRVLAVNVPSERRSPTWEELHWVKKFFFDKDDVTVLYQPGQSTYMGDNTFWLHIFYPEKPETITPPFLRQYPLRKAGMFTRLYRIIKKRIASWKADDTLTPKKESKKPKSTGF